VAARRFKVVDVRDNEIEEEIAGMESEQLVAEQQVAEQGEVEEIAAVEDVPDAVHAELEALREEVEKAKAQAAEYLDGWQRTQAEFSNYKKRQDGERLQMMSLANAVLLRKLLPVVDDFGRAIETLPDKLSKLTWCEGILLIKHKLDAVLESEGVKSIETDGRAFDPMYHEAVTYEEVPGYDEGQIIGQVQQGYMLGERVLRPALVRVAKAPAVELEEDDDTTDNEDKE
jgi:molecular chaperone GrpE